MKLIILILSLGISLNVFAGEAKTLFKTQGITPTGQACTYSVVHKKDWQGQLVFFINGPEVEFKLEFKTDKLFTNNMLVPFIKEAWANTLNNTLLYAVPISEDQDTIIAISIKYNIKFDLSKPRVILAIAPDKKLKCTFGY